MNRYNANGKTTGHSTVKCKCWGRCTERLSKRATPRRCGRTGCPGSPGRGVFRAARVPGTVGVDGGVEEEFKHVTSENRGRKTAAPGPMPLMSQKGYSGQEPPE